MRLGGVWWGVEEERGGSRRWRPLMIRVYLELGFSRWRGDEVDGDEEALLCSEIRVSMVSRTPRRRDL